MARKVETLADAAQLRTGRDKNVTLLMPPGDARDAALLVLETAAAELAGRSRAEAAAEEAILDMDLARRAG